MSDNPNINKLRQAIAKATLHSKNNIPHFYLNTRVNMSNLLKFRKDQKLKGNKYSLNAILMQAISKAFKTFPDSNCTYKDNGEFFINDHHNIGIAVDSKFGLKMPVIKKINDLSLKQINFNLNDKINLTRDNKLSPSDLSDGVISISNLGSFNIRSFDAIILPGQTYILAVGQIFEDVFVDKGKIEIGSKTAASNLMRTTLFGNNTGVGPLAFFKGMNQTYIDPTIDNTDLPTNARTTSFPDYLANVAQKLLTEQKASQSKAESQVANPDEFKTSLSSIQYLRPAFETIGKTAFSLFGAGAPYDVGIPFGVNVPANANKDQIKQLSSILQGQLSQYYTYIEDKVAQANFPNLGMYDMYNNAEVLSYGAQSAFGALANSDTNAITRYLKQEDLIKPKFDWQTLKDQTLTMFRAVGGSKRANKFLDGEQGRLSADDKLDLSTIIGDGDDFAAVDAGGGINREDKPELNTLRDVINLAFNPYNRFDEITDRKILINAIKSRFMGATDGPNGRPLFSQQMMQNTLDSMDAIKLWFGGEPGANADIAQPPGEFNADGLPKGVKENQQKKIIS